MTIETMKLALEALQEAVYKAGWIGMSPEGADEIQREVDEYVTHRLEPAITALRNAIERTEKQEPVAQIIALGQYEFPGLEWLSADHSFRAPIGTLLYTTPPAAQPAPLQISPTDFVDMVMDKEDAIGKPLFWAEWPNREKNT